MISTLTPEDWRRLAKGVRDGTCTPFIGAGASHPTVELAGTIARAWAEECRYPLPDRDDLSRVAQYLALNPEGNLQDPLFPKQKFVDYLDARGQPDFSDETEPYCGLAALPVPLFLTTNYDRFMFDALKSAGRAPKMEYCRWHRSLREQKSLLDRSFVPDVSAPLVYHLHGTQDVAESLVLTEDDYIDFIVNVSRNMKIVPSFVRDALTDNTLIFLGYSLSDWNFRVLFRSMQEYRGKSTRRGHVAVQLEPGGLKKEEADRAIKFLERYFSSQYIVVFFGSVRSFVITLNDWVSTKDGEYAETRVLQPPDTGQEGNESVRS